MNSKDEFDSADHANGGHYGSATSPTRPRNLVFRTLPNGCIPQSKFPWANFDFNHIDIWRTRTTAAADPARRPLASRKSVWPIWPPDLFGITSRLHEHTGIYQQVRPRNFDPNQDLSVERRNSALFPWLASKGHFSFHDRFGIQNLHQVILRAVGAIWGSGALVISGLDVMRVNEQDKSLEFTPATDQDVIASCIEQCKVAVEYLRVRLNSEIEFNKFLELFKYIHDYYSYWTSDNFLEGETVWHEKKGRLAECKLSTRSLIIEHIKKSTENSKKAKAAQKKLKAEGTSNTHSPEPEYELEYELALVLWACDYIYFHWLALIGSESEIDGDTLNNERFAADNDGRFDLDWEAAVVRLHIISDEAAKGVGFGLSSGYSLSSYDGAIFGKGRQQLGLSISGIWDQFCLNRQTVPNPYKQPPRTLTRCFHGSFGSVLPKARTPSTGCSIRSLSHNLCLLPPKGQVRARWSKHPSKSISSTYNILLVPYPYTIKSKHVFDAQVRPGSKADWSYFKIAPNWLYEDSSNINGRIERPSDPGVRRIYHAAMWQFLKSLLDDQAADTVDAIVFPEGSLDWETFDYLQVRILQYPNEIDDNAASSSGNAALGTGSQSRIKMLVAGLTQAPRELLSHPSAHALNLPPGSEEEPHLIEGNFVATFIRHEDEPKKGDESTGEEALVLRPIWGLRHVRAKHHRWRLDKAQLRTYALSHRLDPSKLWWENIPLPPREMLFSEFSTGSILTTLICEDLARIDPCQAAIRAVGPNLIFVLLMDSAQVVERWPYQYAGVLSDDPGSSVLTLTSFGLIRRASHSDGYSSRSVALWREPSSGRPEKVELPEGYHAVLITLRQEFGRERTLDGRGDNGDSASVWRLAGRMPIRARFNPPGGGPDGEYPKLDLTPPLVHSPDGGKSADAGAADDRAAV